MELNNVPGLTLDFSLGGFCVEVTPFFKPGSHVYGRIDWAGERFEYSGHVIWSKEEGKGYRVGVRFIGVERAFREQLGPIPH